MSRKRPAAKKTLRREFLLRREKTNSVVGRGQEHSALVEKAATTRHREQTRRRELFLRGKTNWVTKSALRRPRRKGCDHESPKARSKSTLQPKDGAGRAVPGSLRLVERGLLGSPRRRNEPVHSSAGSAAAAWQNHGACRRQMARRLGVFGRRPPAFQPERPGSASGPEADGAPARPSPSVCAIRRPGDWVAARRDDCADSDWRTQFGQRGRADQQERARCCELEKRSGIFRAATRARARWKARAAPVHGGNDGAPAGQARARRLGRVRRAGDSLAHDGLHEAARPVADSDDGPGDDSALSAPSESWNPAVRTRACPPAHPVRPRAGGGGRGADRLRRPGMSASAFSLL